jgi:hypothetical protein
VLSSIIRAATTSSERRDKATPPSSVPSATPSGPRQDSSSMRSRGSFPQDLPRILVVAQRDERRVSEVVIAGPFDELEVPN